MAIKIGRPYGLAIDRRTCSLFVADAERGLVYKIAPSGTFTIVAGSENATSPGDNGPATSASLNGPQGIALDGSGNLYIAEYAALRKVTAAGTISTLAGDHKHCKFSADMEGGDAAAATVCPESVAVNSRGTVYVTDVFTRRLFMISGGKITTIDSKLFFPEGVIADDHNVYVADDNAYTVYMYPAGGGARVVFAGGGNTKLANGVAAVKADMGNPLALAFDAGFVVYMSSWSRVMYVQPKDQSIQVLAGSSDNTGKGGDGGPASAARFNHPEGLAIDASGNVYISDTENGELRVIKDGSAGRPANSGDTIIRLSM